MPYLGQQEKCSRPARMRANIIETQALYRYFLLMSFHVVFVVVLDVAIDIRVDAKLDLLRRREMLAWQTGKPRQFLAYSTKMPNKFNDAF